MRTNRVVVVPYNETWSSAFEEIKKELESAVGELIIGIEHVGSTSVEGLSAKPCIDIDVIIKDYSIFDAVVSKLKTTGYIHEGNLGIKDRDEAFLFFPRQATMFFNLFDKALNTIVILHEIITTKGFNNATNRINGNTQN